MAGASKVIVVEPSEEALRCIRLNLASEIQQGKVVVCPKGIWKHEGRLWLGSNDPANPEDKSVRESQETEGEWIEVTTIDSLVAELGALVILEVVPEPVRARVRRRLRCRRDDGVPGGVVESGDGQPATLLTGGDAGHDARVRASADHLDLVTDKLDRQVLKYKSRRSGKPRAAPKRADNV